MIDHSVMFDVFLGATSYFVVASGTRVFADIFYIFMPSTFERMVAALSKVDIKYQDGVMTATTKGE